MSDNQFILQSAKIESKLNVRKKKNKIEKKGKEKQNAFQYDRSLQWLQGVSLGEE
jgi:hypothetical protein